MDTRATREAALLDPGGMLSPDGSFSEGDRGAMLAWYVLPPVLGGIIGGTYSRVLSFSRYDRMLRWFRHDKTLPQDGYNRTLRW